MRPEPSFVSWAFDWNHIHHSHPQRETSGYRFRFSCQTRPGLLLLLLVGLCSTMAGAQDGSPSPQQQAPEQEEQLEPYTQEELDQVLAEYRELLKTGQKARAADSLVAVIQDQELAPFHSHALGLLGALFQELDLPFAALVAYTRSLESSTDLDPASIEAAFALADSVGDTAILEPVFAENVGGQVDRSTRSRMAYLAARENLRQGKLGLALGLLNLVAKDSPLRAEASLLEGVILNQQARPTKALEAFLAAIESAADGDDYFLNIAMLNLARSYYAAQNFPRAIEYFARVGRGSDFWLEAQFERAWAHFRLDDMDGVLALLQTHRADFFKDYYFPEAELLRIYALFLLCKFPEATLGVESFKEHYQPVLAGLRDALGSLTPQELFEITAEYARGGDPAIPEMFLRPYRNEARFRAAMDAASHADDETARVENVSANPFTTLASSWVGQRRDQIIQEEGQRLLGVLRARAEELQGMLNNAEMSKLDMLQMETRLYEQASRDTRALETERRVERKERVRKGYLWWPWEGEYWADELGYYRVHTIPECPVGMRSGD